MGLGGGWVVLEQVVWGLGVEVGVGLCLGKLFGMGSGWLGFERGVWRWLV